MNPVFLTVTETVPAVTDAAEVVVDATVPLMEQLAPLYDAVVVGCNLAVIGICAVGVCAGILLGFLLWRWLK